MAELFVGPALQPKRPPSPFANALGANGTMGTQDTQSTKSQNSTKSTNGTKGTKSPKGAHGLLLDVLIENRKLLVNLARSFVDCRSRAEDVVHDVFVKLTAFPNQDDIRQPLAYVTRIVRNASIDACRRQALENTWHACEEDGLEVPSSEPGPESALATRNALQHAFDALAELPERTRVAFERVRLAEETLQETARALNVSQTLVHFMVRDAAKHCADCVQTGKRAAAREVAPADTRVETGAR
jgi:RNA polymerase sigma factor (sigma-70 family)